MGSTRMYSVRYNSKRVYGPVTSLQTAVEHWEGLVCDTLIDDGFARPKPVRLF